MNKPIYWGLLFLALYGVHAVFFLTYEGRLGLPVASEIARPISIVSLAALTLLVVAFIATRDEVLRRLAFVAGALSAVATAFFAYGLSAFDMAAPFITSNLWAFAIAVFLVAYGALSWRARS